MAQSAQSLCQMRSIPHCPKAVFYVFVFYSIHNSAIKLIIAPPSPSENVSWMHIIEGITAIATPLKPI